jgi:hypothetical protein
LLYFYVNVTLTMSCHQVVPVPTHTLKTGGGGVVTV